MVPEEPLLAREGVTQRALSSVEKGLPHEPLKLGWPAELMTAAEVAGVMRVTPKMVREHIRRGALRALRLGGNGPYRIRIEDAQRWAEAQLAKPDESAMAVDRYVRRRLVQVAAVDSAPRRRRRAGGLVG
jgi:excisionase family DNA binding protein